jgi:hypothetical protein
MQRWSSHWWRAGSLLLCMHAATALAAPTYPTERRLTVGGFGTLGMLYQNEDGLEYRRFVGQPHGAEAGKLDFATDTIGGVQLNAAWNQHLDVVVQAVTRLNSNNNWDPQLTRAFVRWNPSETFTARVGRLGLEIYPRADSRDVGYSQLTIRPVVEIFGLSPIDRFDGGELAFKRPVGDGLISFKLWGGRGGGDIVAQDGSISSVDHSVLWGGHVEYAQGPWIFRIGSGAIELDEPVGFGGLPDALRATGVPQSVALANDLDDNARKTWFHVAGMTYDEGPVQVRLFAAHIDIESKAMPAANVGQLVGGYRIDDFTPYAMFAFSKSGGEVRSTGLPDTPDTAALNAAAAAAQRASRYGQHSLALGLRWDFMPKLALKFQVDRVWINDSFTVLNRRPDPADNAEMTVFGVALDFVF